MVFIFKISSLVGRPSFCLTTARAPISRYARPIFPQDKPQKSKYRQIPWRVTNQVYRPNINAVRPIVRDDHSMAARIKYPVKLENGGSLHYRMIHYPKEGAPPDPPHKPTKLLLVMMGGRSTNNLGWGGRHVMIEIGLSKSQRAVMVKNTPEMCAKLKLISCVTEILPCELPDDFEDDPNPLNYFIHEDGKIDHIKDVQFSKDEIEESLAPLRRKFLDQKVRANYQLGWGVTFN